MVDAVRDGRILQAKSKRAAKISREGDRSYPVVGNVNVPGRDGETGETTVREYVEQDGRRILRAFNGDWAERAVDRSNDTDILCVVVFVGRKV